VKDITAVHVETGATGMVMVVLVVVVVLEETALKVMAEVEVHVVDLVV
jgi:hypothetical protein